VQSAAFDRHETDLFRRLGFCHVVDREPGRPIALHRRGVRMKIGLALIIVLFVRELRLREHILGIDDQQEILVVLQMQAPGVRWRRDIIDRLWIGRIAHVDDAETF